MIDCKLVSIWVRQHEMSPWLAVFELIFDWLILELILEKENRIIYYDINITIDK